MNGVARCPGGPCAASASRYNADRYVPRVERRPARQAGHAERLDHVIIEQELPAAGTPRVSANRDSPRSAVAVTACRRGPLAASVRWHQIAHNCPLDAASPISHTRIPLKHRRAGRHAARAAPARNCEILATGQMPPQTPAQIKPGQRSRRPSARSASACSAASPSPRPVRQAPLRLRGRPASLHGPYIQWTRTVNGKTVTRLLTPAQYQAYAPWFGNARQLAR